MRQVIVIVFAALLLPRLAIAQGSSCEGTWLPQPGLASRVFCLTTLSNGDVIAGCEGGIGRAAMKLGASTGEWSVMGAGISGLVFDVLELPSGEVLVGGLFFYAGDIYSPGLAKYHPATDSWSSTGSPVCCQVLTLARTMNGDVIVGGSYSTSSNTSLQGVARYTPETNAWSSLGSGLQLNVSGAVELANGELLASGLIQSSGMVGIIDLARYDNILGVWSNVDARGEMGPLVLLPDDRVLVGGYVQQIAGVSVQGLGVLDPVSNAVTDLHASANTMVYAIQLLDDGDFVAGGGNIGVGTASFGRVARFHSASNSWSVLGSANAAVRALTRLPGGDLLIGGDFTVAGGIPAEGIGRFRFADSCPPDYDCSGSLSVQDVFDFLRLFFGQDLGADFDESGGVSVQDLFEFLDAYFTGCPA